MRKTITKAFIGFFVLTSIVVIIFSIISHRNSEAYKYKILDISYDIYSDRFYPYDFCFKVAEALNNSKNSDEINAKRDSILKSWYKIEVMKSEKVEIDKSIKSLKHPPKKFKEAYNVLQQEYEEYNQIYYNVFNPSGSYKTFTNECYKHYKNIEKYHKTISQLL